MMIETREARLAVISDLHVGNPYSRAGHALGAFFDYARHRRLNLCINGDGFEILQASFAALASDSVDVLSRLKAHLDDGLRVYYVVGNHDIALENFISNWSTMEITPFLNVTSGPLRIRIEHGHLYDPSFVRSPALYEWLTRMAGPLLHLYPDVYRLWSMYEETKARARRWYRRGPQHDSVYAEAADMLLRRGFDVVIFGHTHRALDVELAPGRRYINAGNWMRGGSFVEIIDGEVNLKHWTDPEGARVEPLVSG